MKQILIIDGYSFLFRAYYAIKDTSIRSDGLATGGVFGFANMILNLLETVPHSHIVVVFDTGKKTFRSDIYPDYKANRVSCPLDLIPQFSLARELISSMNISYLEKEGFEADDIIATLSRIANEEEFNVVVASGDKDLIQLVNEKTIIYNPFKRKRIEVNDVFEQWGVMPFQILDTFSIIGDASDNVPGIKGLGPKGAIELINQFQTLEGIYDNIDLIKASSRKDKIIAGKELAFLSRDLIRLHFEVDKYLIDDLAIKDIDYKIFLDFLNEMEFNSIIKKIEQKNLF